MNRRNFLKNLGIGVGVLATAMGAVVGVLSRPFSGKNSQDQLTALDISKIRKKLWERGIKSDQYMFMNKEMLDYFGYRHGQVISGFPKITVIEV